MYYQRHPYSRCPGYFLFIYSSYGSISIPMSYVPPPGQLTVCVPPSSPRLSTSHTQSTAAEPLPPTWPVSGSSSSTTFGPAGTVAMLGAPSPGWRERRRQWSAVSCRCRDTRTVRHADTDRDRAGTDQTAVTRGSRTLAENHEMSDRGIEKIRGGAHQIDVAGGLRSPTGKEQSYR